MKKIFYITLFALFTFFMVACDETNYSFSIVVDNVSELRESVVFDLTLLDENKELEKSEIKGTISKKGSDTVITTKNVTFDSENKEELSFTGLTADTEYSVTIYAGYSGKKVTLVERNVKTSNEGTDDAPYSIDSYDDFTNIVKKDRDAYFKLVNDIDFNGKSISPMFTSTSPFIGHFDGNGYTIRNFKVADKDEEGNNKHVSSSSQYYGLFGYIGEGGKVSNVTLDSFTVYVARSTSLSSTKSSNYGLLAGYCAGTIENVTVTNSSLNVKSSNKTKDLVSVGGLVGNLAEKGTITNVSVTANIKVDGVIDAVVGGVCGSTVNSKRITKTENDVTVKVANISKASYTGDITVDLSGSTVSVPTTVGGIVGKNFSSLIDDCSSAGTITVNSAFTKAGNQTFNVGGLVGWMISDNAVLSNSNSSVSFTITSLDTPTVSEEKLTINAGLLVGKNGGLAPAKSIVSNCKYTLATGAVNTINASEFAVVKTGLVANEVSTSNDCLLESAVVVKVNRHTVVDGAEEPTIVDDSKTIAPTVTE